MSAASLFSAKLLNASLFRFEVLGSRAQRPRLGAKGDSLHASKPNARAALDNNFSR
jgi:hypothetical protein